MEQSVWVRRIQDQATHNDGTRVLVDRLWPRGMKKEDVLFDHWNKDVAPSTELRQWYGHDPEKFDEFSRRYRRELETPAGQRALHELRACVRGKRLTLLTATKDVEHSQAAVLAKLLRPAGSP
ncbi:DUF488 domain-containing protein [Tessaracoccus antarcticus]|uniref:DUF488 family protein n=1 Tax=Tessaracoccus antarcticus TaxID=2479848 RepID=A0A3M0G1G3_9ACTN|nr:DUF488 family protein [Tessaracoccus antarcticus]RMB58754.1 DUF488 family protein [Tessaracoccus antarcticus]